MNKALFLKALVIRESDKKLNDVGQRLQYARQIGKKAFNGQRFKVIDIRGRFDYGWIAVYLFERSTVPMSEGNRLKSKGEN